jgi:hypothetical protein
MGAGATDMIVLASIASIAWFAAMALICAALGHATRPPWWESTQLDIESLDSGERLSTDDVATCAAASQANWVDAR